MGESLRTRLMRWYMNVYPAYRGTGGRVTYIASDWREVRVQVPLSWRTRNLVGTIFGGSLYGAVDPIYMIQLMRLLGPEYVVWDKAATIRFRKPGRETLHATFRVPDAVLETIRRTVHDEGRAEHTFVVQLVDASGVEHATIEKVVFVRRRDLAQSADPR